MSTQPPLDPVQSSEPSQETTHFGFQRVKTTEKAHRVAEVFHSVADNYDLMNDLMSLGLHRLWKRALVGAAACKPGQWVLDLAGGTGDIASALAPKVGPRGGVILSDINESMLSHGRDRLMDEGLVGNVSYVQVDAQAIPFPEESFHCITMAFGLRNVTDKQTALNEMFRVLKPGGRCLVLEFSTLSLKALKPLYDAYSFKVLPKLGEWVAKDEGSYRYLAESIRMHPDQQTLQSMMESAGFELCGYNNYSGGIVAIHRGYKL